jgi:hypothetical protein
MAARMRGVFPIALVWTAIALCGCHSSSESMRQTRAESISVGKANDSALLASGSGSVSTELVATATNAAGSGSGSPSPVTQAASAASTGSRWSKLFGRKETPDRVVLPRNDQEAENGILDGAADKTAANEF